MKFQALRIIIVFCIPVLLYLHTVNYGFTYFDDNLIIVNNLNFLSNFSNAKTAFLTDAFAAKSSSFSFYRPLQTLSYMVDIQLSGGKGNWMFHLSNIILAGLICLLLFILLRRFHIPPSPALLFSIIYCSHPLFVSSVAWIPARGDLLLMLFSLLSFLFFLDFLRSRRIVFLVLNVLAYIVALFCKETAALLPVLLSLYYFLYIPGKEYKKKYLLIILLYAITFSFWFWMRSEATGNISAFNNTIGIKPFLLNLRTIPESLAKFFLLLNIAPVPGYTFLKTVSGLVIILLIVIIFFKNFKTAKKEKIFSTGWFLILMFPPMIYKNTYIDYLDHRFFLPLAGILIFTIFSIPLNWYHNWNIKKNLFFIIIFVILGSMTYFKSLSYSDPMIFCNSAVLQNSNSAMAYNNRGNLKNSINDFSGALYDYNKAISIRSDYTEAYNNRGNVKLSLGDSLGGMEDYTKALDICNVYYLAYYNRGFLKSKRGDNHGAMIDYNEAISIRPDYAEAYNNRGLVKSNLGDDNGALMDCTSAISIRPDYKEAYNNRGVIKSKMGDNAGAVEDYSKAISICPWYDQAYYYRGLVKSIMGDINGAIADYDEAIRLRPIYPEAFNSKGAALGTAGNFNEAINNFNRAVELNPGYWKAYGNRAITRFRSGDIAGTIKDCNKVLELVPGDQKALNLRTEAEKEMHLRGNK